LFCCELELPDAALENLRWFEHLVVLWFVVYRVENQKQVEDEDVANGSFFAWQQGLCFIKVSKKSH